LIAEVRGQIAEVEPFASKTELMEIGFYLCNLTSALL
jgi:hypothetical protein